jgi:hypothetical protein
LPFENRQVNGIEQLFINYAVDKIVHTIIQNNRNSGLNEQAANLIKMYEHETKGLIQILKQMSKSKPSA